jgi:hypothetical protein
VETQIPIYRALKLGTKDEYVEGALIPNAFFKRETKEPCCYIFDNSKMDYDCFIDIGEQLDDFEIDPSTLAIHFPAMVDSEGNKIFASLSEDGKGGDICNYIFFDGDNRHDTAKFNWLQGMNPFHLKEVKRQIKVTGIQQ